MDAGAAAEMDVGSDLLRVDLHNARIRERSIYVHRAEEPGAGGALSDRVPTRSAGGAVEAAAASGQQFLINFKKMSSDEGNCWICGDQAQPRHFCQCRGKSLHPGSLECVHTQCLEKWLNEKHS